MQKKTLALTLLELVLAIVLVTLPVMAQQATPPSAAVPKEATLKMSSTEVKAWKEWAYSLALQAATWGGPLVTMYSLRYNDAVGEKAKAQPNNIWRMENISTPELSKEAGYVTPNVNTVYGFGFMDLRREPIILSVPDSQGLYYMVEIVDMWTNAFACFGGKATGYKGGKFALVGPGWQGKLPKGLKRIDCPTPWILLQPRVHLYVKGKVDLVRARKVLDEIKPMGLAEFIGKKAPAMSKYNYPAPDYANPNQPVSALEFKDPLQFWDLLSIGMNENPPPQDQITALVPMFKPLGLEPGKPWDRTKLSPQVLEAMQEAAQNIGSMLASQPIGTFYRGAFLPPPTIGNPGTDYRTRAIVARVGLTANTPDEAVYWMYPLDNAGNYLAGTKQYTMTFKEKLPYIQPGFWSLTIYDAKNNYTIPNPLKRYMLGSDTPEMKANPDGSFTIYIQKDNPGPDKEANWLPSGDGPFYLIARSYAPTQQTMDILTNIKAWPVPAVVPVPK